MLLQDFARLRARIYDAAWQRAREARPGHRPLSDPFLWHDFYRFYIEQLKELLHGGPLLVESHLSIVGKIAGQIARRRFPMPFANAGKDARDGQLDIVQELIGLGNLGLLATPVGSRSWARSTPSRTTGFGSSSAKGITRTTSSVLRGLSRPPICRSVGFAVFPVGLTATKSVSRGDDGDDDEFDFLDSEGRTSRKYLQRHIGEGGARFLWRDEGTYANPRLKLPGSPNGKASDELICEPERTRERRQRDWQDTYFLEGVEDVARCVLTGIELRVFRARFLNKRKPTHAALGVELNRTRRN